MNHLHTGMAIVGMLSLAISASAEPAKEPARSPSVELVVLTGQELARIEVRIEVNGETVTSIWNRTFDRLFAYYDRNGDGRIDPEESKRLPSPFGLRRILWGQSSPGSGPPLKWKALDSNGDGKVTREELAAFYRRSGLGMPLVAVGRPQSTQDLTATLLKRLDTDGNGTVSESEWKAAPTTLSSLDRNDDELIGPGEIVPGVAYPGALGTLQLQSAGMDERKSTEFDAIPVLLLPTDPADVRWTADLIRRRDRSRDGMLDIGEASLTPRVFAALDSNRDGKLSASELVAWRNQPPSRRIDVTLGKTIQVDGTVEASAFSMPALRLSLRADEGKMLGMVAVARKRLLDRFVNADQDGDGLLDPEDVKSRASYDLQQLFPIADTNRDGKLSRKEVEAWLNLQDQIASGHVLVTVLDHGAGLFELLDENQDGSLSTPELRRAWERLKAGGCARDGAFDSARLPRHLILTASRGHPSNPLRGTQGSGPGWFRAMDRNGDGYVSRREFTGPIKVFEQLDQDRDGFLSSTEARKAQPK